LYVLSRYTWQDDFTPMAPSPGDPASDQFQLQSDGALFHKIKMGRGTMPKFEELSLMTNCGTNCLHPKF